MGSSNKLLIIPARGPKQCCKERVEEMPGLILQVRFVKISVEDRLQDLLGRFSVEAAVQDPFVRLSAICTRCL